MDTNGEKHCPNNISLNRWPHDYMTLESTTKEYLIDRVSFFQLLWIYDNHFQLGTPAGCRIRWMGRFDCFSRWLIISFLIEIRGNNQWKRRQWGDDKMCTHLVQFNSMASSYVSPTYPPKIEIPVHFITVPTTHTNKMMCEYERPTDPQRGRRRWWLVLHCL